MTTFQCKQQDKQVTLIGEMTFPVALRIYQEGLTYLNQGLHHFDLSDVTKVDSSGLVVLLSWLKKVKETKTSIIFSNLPQQLIDIATISGVMNLLRKSIHGTTHY